MCCFGSFCSFLCGQLWFWLFMCFVLRCDVLLCLASFCVSLGCSDLCVFVCVLLWLGLCCVVMIWFVRFRVYCIGLGCLCASLCLVTVCVVFVCYVTCLC